MTGADTLTRFSCEPVLPPPNRDRNRNRFVTRYMFIEPEDSKTDLTQVGCRQIHADNMPGVVPFRLVDVRLDADDPMLHTRHILYTVLIRCMSLVCVGTVDRERLGRATGTAAAPGERGHGHGLPTAVGRAVGGIQAAARRPGVGRRGTRGARDQAAAARDDAEPQGRWRRWPIPRSLPAVVASAAPRASGSGRADRARR